MEKIKKIDRYLFKFVSVEEIKKKNNKIETLNNCNKNIAKENGKKEQEKKQIKDEYKALIKIKDKEINRLQDEVMSARKETLDEAAKIDLLKIEHKNEIKRLNGQKGGYKKEINKLLSQLDAKERVINEYQKALSAEQSKNANQAAKIRELSNSQEHTIEEYKNNGLPQQTKKAIKKKYMTNTKGE